MTLHPITQAGKEAPFLRHDWSIDETLDLFAMPLNDLLFTAHTSHRNHFDPNEIQLSVLCNIKEGGCPEDCAYCPQSARYQTGVENEAILETSEVIKQATAARNRGASRFCMGAAWRSPKDKDIELVAEKIGAVKALGLESCATLGMLTAAQADTLKAAGLDYYNHNLDTSPEHYGKIISTRTYDDRLRTLKNVRQSGIKVCSGGIIGMGEAITDRAGLLIVLANQRPHPESVPVNMLVRVAGTPLAHESSLDPIDLIRMIAVARIMMPESYVRLSAGRNTLSETEQAMCYFAGANSIFYGEKLLTTSNPEHEKDQKIFHKLGLKAKD